MTVFPVVMMVRAVFAMIALVCAGVLAFAYYLQHVHLLDPCPWCIVQRLLFILAGLIALAGLLWNGRTKVCAVAGAAVTLSGAAAAGYQIWLQGDPARAMSCSGSWIEYTLDALHLGPLWPNYLQYDGPCTLSPWDLFGFSIPEWSLIFFVMLSLDFLAVFLISAKK